MHFILFTAATGTPHMRFALLSFVSAFVVALPSARLAAQATVAPTSPTAVTPTAVGSPAPVVGQMAPDFTAAWADASGARATPVTLSALRGKVVVLAFYPLDRSGGCTAELIKFRDEHAALFGEGTVVLPISVDSVSTHASWSAEMKFPFALVADPTLAVAELYGSRSAGKSYSNRTVFVIGKDGKIAWRDLRFGALSEDAYTALAAAVSAAR
ncbi:MAG TPA: redoxin domain-containing protein [Gemmatimonas sp.]|nr:redoxin domain-containing protein [Gemmatimonas sp.]